MPTVAVHDLLVHPRENDLVVGTYGRGLYITDITPLQEMNEKVLEEDIYFFEIEAKVQRITSGWGWYHLYGDRILSTPNESNAIVINYYLRNKIKEKVKITITDPYGQKLAELEGPANTGINTLLWDMRRRLTKEEEKAYMNARSRDREPTSRMVPPGEYLVVLEVGDRRFTQKALIKKRAGWPLGFAGSNYEY